ncbi:MAG: glycosyltransferase [Bacteroidales bacterium]
MTYFEACDFKSYPLGGTLSFSRQFIQSYSNDITLVGFVNNDEPVGIWFKRTIDNKTYDYFGLCRVSDVEKTLVPKRLYSYWLLKKHIKKIIREKDVGVFTQSPQFVFILSRYKWDSFIFLFAGLGNSVKYSRFKFLRFFGSIYEFFLFKRLKLNATKILAASDQKTIKSVCLKYDLPESLIIQFPTRYDQNIFRQINKTKIRNSLAFDQDEIVFVTTGRLSYIKGWSLAIDTFRIVKTKIPKSKLIFIGDGEDKIEIESYGKDEIEKNEIILKGRLSQEEIAYYLNASDVFVMSSIIEGWPTAMVEALACGKPIVSTNVSGASEMIFDNQNGYILKNRNKFDFAELWIKALQLNDPNELSLQLSKRFTMTTLESDFVENCFTKI